MAESAIDPFYKDASNKTGKSTRVIYEGLFRAEHLLPEVKEALKEKDIGKTGNVKHHFATPLRAHA